MTSSPPAFEPTLTAWVASLSSDSTRSAYRGDLVKFREWCDGRGTNPLNVTVEDVMAYQRSVVSSGVSTATARRRSSSVSSFFDFAVTSGVVETNPVLGTLRPTIGASSATPVLDQHAVSVIVDAARHFDPRAHALVALLAFDGLRLNEALALDSDDVSAVDAVATHVTVDRSGRPTSITLDPRSVSPISRCSEGRSGEPLFTSQRAQRLTRFGADHLLKRIPAPSAEPLSANALRRYFVSSSHTARVDDDAISVPPEA